MSGKKLVRIALVTSLLVSVFLVVFLSNVSVNNWTLDIQLDDGGDRIKDRTFVGSLGNVELDDGGDPIKDRTFVGFISGIGLDDGGDPIKDRTFVGLVSDLLDF